MDVIPVACLRDNYAYIARAGGSREAVVIDPSEAAPVLTALDSAGLKLAGILNTHHHWDHVGGNEELVERLGPLPVYGHASDRGRIPAQTVYLDHGDGFDVVGLHFDVLHIPGHTLGAVAYVCDGAVFTGDTLFIGGCGRLFEGTAAQMYASLNRTLGALPEDTRVYCGHEYTESNLRFAAHVEPGNPHVPEAAARAREIRGQGRPTVPSTLGEERRINPFMRCDSEEIVRSVADRLTEDRSPEAVLGAVRALKDAF